MPVPNFLFEASCWIHDFNYWLGNTESDRVKADIQFYDAMLCDVAKKSWYLRWFYNLMAWSYFKAVRRLGANFFYYGDRERTREDLHEEIRLQIINKNG